MGYPLDMSRKAEPETPLYVRIPTAASEKLDRAAAALGVPKKELVAGLVRRYVDPDSERGLSSLGALSTRPPPGPLGAPEGGPRIGTYSFQPYAPPEIMNAAQAAQFLQISEREVLELAAAGKLPGKQLGRAWRFSRDALVAWLSTPAPGAP